MQFQRKREKRGGIKQKEMKGGGRRLNKVYDNHNDINLDQ